MIHPMNCKQIAEQSRGPLANMNLTEIYSIEKEKDEGKGGIEENWMTLS